MRSVRARFRSHHISFPVLPAPMYRKADFLQPLICSSRTGLSGCGQGLLCTPEKGQQRPQRQAPNGLSSFFWATTSPYPSSFHNSQCFSDNIKKSHKIPEKGRPQSALSAVIEHVKYMLLNARTIRPDPFCRRPHRNKPRSRRQ